MRKYITLILAVVLLGLAFISANALKNSKKPPMVAKTKTMLMAFSETVKNEDLPILIPASGSIKAKNKIKIYAEVQGILELNTKEFKPGVLYKRGEVLVRLNKTEFYNQVMAQKSSFYNQILAIMPDIRLDFPESFQLWEHYLNSFDLTIPIMELPKASSDKEKLFIASKNLFNTYYTIKNLEVKLSKYTIVAPFDGVLTEANVNPGTLVSPGQVIGEFIDTRLYELEVALSTKLASHLSVGDKVNMQAMEDKTQQWSGTIVRINGKVDKSSQTVNVFIELSGKNLQEGLYLKALITAQSMPNTMEIARNLLVNESMVYLVADSVLKLTPIQVVHENEKTVLIQGLKEGQNILSQPIPRAFNGMRVKPVQEKL
jgi:multidrug efflux pump subunit AcrA (membrane-fusion protein)